MRTSNLIIAILSSLVLSPAGEALAQPETDMSPDIEPTVEPEPEPESESEPESASASASGSVAINTSAATDTSWSIGIAPRLGLTIPTSKLGPMVVGGLELDYLLPVLDGRLAATVDISITRPAHDGGATDTRVGGNGDYDLAESELKLGVGGVFRLSSGDRRLIPWGGLGVVMHMLKTTQTNSFAPGENTSQDTRFGFELVGGADFGVGPGYLLGEVRIVYTGLDHLLTGESNAGNVMASAGYRLVF